MPALTSVPLLPPWVFVVQFRVETDWRGALCGAGGTCESAKPFLSVAGGVGGFQD
jgi:hypothetical protein